MAGSVFISYASADQQTADKLVAEIERRGIKCWISSRDIRPGEDYQGAIVAALEASSVVLLLFSRHANASTDIPRELGLAGRFKKTVIPARLEDIVPSGPFAYQMTTAQFIDLFRDFETKVDELCSFLGQTLQVADVVRQRIAREHRRSALRRKLRRAGIGVLVLLVLAVVGFAMAPRLEGWLSAREHPEVSPQPSPPSAPAQVAQPAPAQPAPVAPVAAPPSVAIPPPAAVSAPSAQLPKGVLASRTYEGISFDVMSARTDGNNLKLLVNATDTQKRDAQLQFFSNPPPQAIDNWSDASSGYQVKGVPDCGSYLNNCSGLDATHWSKLYQDTPLTIVLQFSGQAAFSGSSVNVTFNVLLGESADGGPPQTIPFPVVFTNLPLKDGATLLSAQASRTYEGIRFDVMSARTDGDNIKLLITATDTQKRDAKLLFFSNPAPNAIDDHGDTSSGYRVVGIPDCGSYLINCTQQDASHWSKLYPNSPLIIILQLSGPAAFSGSSVNVTFNMLLGTEPADGGSGQTTPFPVVFTNLPIKPGAALPSAQASRTYEGIRFDVMSARSGANNNLKMLITATDSQKRDAKLQFFSNPAPHAIDDRGGTSNGYREAGIPDCGSYLNNCSAQDASHWSKLYPDSPLIIVLQFSGPAAFSNSVSVSFNVLLSTEAADGGSPTTKLVQVSLPGVALK